MVVAGAFQEAEDVRSNSDINTDRLKQWHAEGDTRLILHALEENYENIVVMANDTDVFILLVAHWQHIRSKNVWLMTGTSTKRCYIPIREVCNKLPEDVREALLAFHAITGCDSTSFTFDHSKKKCFDVLLRNCNLLYGIGEGDMTIAKHGNIERFFCKMYNLPDQITTVNEGRHHLFAKTIRPECLPPTSDALRFHAKRCHYQTMIWKNIQTPEVKLTNTGIQVPMPIVYDLIMLIKHIYSVLCASSVQSPRIWMGNLRWSIGANPNVPTCHSRELQRNYFMWLQNWLQIIKMQL